MKKHLPISVLITAYNAAPYIKEAINSICNQTYRDFELLIIDDASTDNTWSILQYYAKKDKRIHVFHNKQNRYIAENRNKLVSLARGKYIAWQDADDISLPQRLEKQYQFMELHKEVGIVGGYLQFFNEKGNLSMRKYADDDAFLRRKIFQYSPVAMPAAMVRKQVLNKVGTYNPKYSPADDIDMSFRIGQEYKFSNIQEVVIKYRVHKSSATFKKLKKMELDTLEIRRKYANNSSYRMTMFDKIYNFLQFISIYIIPGSFKIKLFSFIRNDN